MKKKHIRADDEVNLSPSQLPAGPSPPLWVIPPREYSQREVLEKLAEIEEMAGLSVTVIYDSGDKNEEAAEFCQLKDWHYRLWAEMTGSENQCVIVINCLIIETISRPHNLLVLVTTPGHK